MMAIVLMEKGISFVNSFEYPIRFIDLQKIVDFIFLYADTINYLKVKTCRKAKHVD